MGINSTNMTKASKKFDAILVSVMYETLCDAGNELIEEALLTKEYGNLTGNTITSISFGLYIDGHLQDYLFIDGLREPIRTKLRRGEIFKGTDYDGRERAFIGSIDTDGDYGYNTVGRFFSAHTPERPNSIVVATGTEYSIYLHALDGAHLFGKARLGAMIKKGFKRRIFETARSYE